MAIFDVFVLALTCSRATKTAFSEQIILVHCFIVIKTYSLAEKN